VVVLIASALAPALRAGGEGGWARASVRGAVSALVGGYVLYSLAERAWWPDVHDGCHYWASPGGGFADAVCIQPWLVSEIDWYVGWPFTHAILLGIGALAALLVGAVGVSVQRRVNARPAPVAP